MTNRPHRFGGEWTTAKLDALSSYLTAYTTALKNQSFKKAYIDAFAGTGTRTSKKPSRQTQLFGETEGVLAGSARRALEVAPPFDRYIFIEQNPTRCRQLDGLRDEFPSRADAIQVRQGDANHELRQLAALNWSNHRAVLFLDPYGMQVEWTTVAAVAATRAIDVWYLFPMWMGVNRLLTRSGRIPAAWEAKLDLIFGTHDWRSRLYAVDRSSDLLGERTSNEKVPATMIASYVKERLASVFAGVAEPAVLRHRSGRPLYLLCFAVANPSARKVALRIAESVLKELR